MRRLFKARARQSNSGRCVCPVVRCSHDRLIGGEYCQFCRENCLPDWRRRRRNRVTLILIILAAPAVAMALTYMLAAWGI
jgi:hypothetical protein